VIVVVDMADAERVVFASFSELDAVEVLVIAPTVIQSEPHGVRVVAGLEIPFALSCEAGIFVHSRDV